MRWAGAVLAGGLQSAPSNPGIMSPGIMTGVGGLLVGTGEAGNARADRVQEAGQAEPG